MSMLHEVEALSLVYVTYWTIKSGSTKLIFELDSHDDVEDKDLKSILSSLFSTLLEFLRRKVHAETHSVIVMTTCIVEIQRISQI